MKSIIAFSVVCLAALPCLGQCLHRHHGQGACVEGCCPECKTVPNEKKGFDVECEKICVPPVKFPWESCCVRKPGTVKVVRKLAKKDYECGKKVVYEWPKPEKVPCCNEGHGCKHIGCARCAGAGCSSCCDRSTSCTAAAEGCTGEASLMLEAPVPPAMPDAVDEAAPAAEPEPTPAVEPAPTPAVEQTSPSDVPPPAPVSMFQRAHELFRSEL